MTKNVGNLDRMFRAVGALVMATCAVIAPLPAMVRIPLFGATAVYMLFTVLSGTCLGYRLTGRSTCPAASR
ncbi:MAG: DUF2892 domain-containing protein [Polyangiaceae bacterium]|nr:DUF2892 domain-containing protein [Polyangiaceae bacterium]